jgi:transposase
MRKPDDLSRSLVALDQDSTLIAVVELSQSSWLVGGVIPGVERRPLKQLGATAPGLLGVLHRWQAEAAKEGRTIRRVCVAFEVGRDGFWLARWLRAQGIEVHVIHPTSVPVKREHRRAKTDRLDVALLMRAFVGWLRGEAEHCRMVAIPTIEEEDARRPSREHETLVHEKTRIVNRIKGALARHGIRGFKPTVRRAAERLAALRTAEGEALPPNSLAERQRDLARLRFLTEQIEQIEASRQERLAQAPDEKGHAMVRQMNRWVGLGLETADRLAHEVFVRDFRDERAVGRYGGLTGAPNQSGSTRREKGLARVGNGRVRQSMLQFGWRFLWFQKNRALANWYRARTADGRSSTRKTMIVALARKLLIALWRFLRTGEVPAGVVLRPAA